MTFKRSDLIDHVSEEAGQTPIYLLAAACGKCLRAHEAQTMNSADSDVKRQAAAVACNRCRIPEPGAVVGAQTPQPTTSGGFNIILSLARVPQFKKCELCYSGTCVYSGAVFRHYIWNNAAAFRQAQTEVCEQLRGGRLGCGHDAQPQFGRSGGPAHGHDHVDTLDLRHLLDELTSARAQRLGLHPLLERAPQRQRQKTHQDMRLDAVLFLVKHRPQSQIAFGGPESRLRLGQLYIPPPQLRGIGLLAIGA